MFGTGSGVANRYGFVHCSVSPNGCASAIGRYALSVPHPQTRQGTPLFFADRIATQLGPVTGSGWVFNTNFSAVQAIRPTRMGRYRYLAGTANLVGTEIGRTVIPEPRPWALLTTGLLAVVALVAGKAVLAQRLR